MKWLFVVLLLSGCANKASEAAEREAAHPKTFQVRCPLTTVESVTDTVRAFSYSYGAGPLYFLGRWNGLTKQFPGTCVVKEISN